MEHSLAHGIMKVYTRLRETSAQGILQRCLKGKEHTPKVGRSNMQRR